MPLKHPLNKCLFIEAQQIKYYLEQSQSKLLLTHKTGVIELHLFEKDVLDFYADLSASTFAKDIRQRQALAHPFMSWQALK